MNSKLRLGQRASVSVGKTPRRGSAVESVFAPRGLFNVEHWRGGLVIANYHCPNGITNEGKNFLFDVMFDGDTAAATWYMLLIDLTGFTALANDDIYDDINQVGNGWDEFVDYTDPGNGDSTVTRPVWNPDPASAQSISNGTQTIFDITDTGTVKGLGLVGLGANANTKGDHAADGKLWATALFDQGDTAVVLGDQLKVTYTVSA